jgi:hypothetical protein
LIDAIELFRIELAHGCLPEKAESLSTDLASYILHTTATHLSFSTDKKNSVMFGVALFDVNKNSRWSQCLPFENIENQVTQLEPLHGGIEPAHVVVDPITSSPTPP